MAIDVHAHILPQAAQDAFTRRVPWHGINLREAPGTDDAPSPLGLPWQHPDQTIAERISDMDAEGVAVQILSITPRLLSYAMPANAAADLAREVNDELVAVTAAHPGRLSAFAHVPMQDPDLAVAELERSAELGLPGVAVGSHVLGRDWDDTAYERFLAACESLERLVFVHPFAVRNRVGLDRRHLHNTIGNPLETTIAIANIILGGVVERHPRLKICFAHGGGYIPVALGRIEHAYQSRVDARGSARANLRVALNMMYFDCITHDEGALRFLIDTVGVEHVFFGSDYPADMGLASPVNWIQSCSRLTDLEKEFILNRNAKREISGM